MTRYEWAAVGIGALAGLLTTVLAVGASSLLPILGTLLVYPLLLLLVGAGGALVGQRQAARGRQLQRGALVGASAGLLQLLALVGVFALVGWVVPFLVLGAPGSPNEAAHERFWRIVQLKVRSREASAQHVSGEHAISASTGFGLVTF